jgi:hypothetical protein
LFEREYSVEVDDRQIADGSGIGLVIGEQVEVEVVYQVSSDCWKFDILGNQ